MASIPGSVRVAGFMAPTDSSDTYAVTDEAYNRGGFRSVADTTARDAITADRRLEGMLVFCKGDGTFYQLMGGTLNANWATASFSDLSAVINDTAVAGVTNKTFSVDKILAVVAAAQSAAVALAVNQVTNGAASALDTLAELATALGNDANYATTVANSLAARVRFDAAQTLSLSQQQQACANIGVGDPDHNFVADYTAAKA